MKNKITFILIISLISFLIFLFLSIFIIYNKKKQPKLPKPSYPNFLKFQAEQPVYPWKTSTYYRYSYVNKSHDKLEGAKSEPSVEVKSDTQSNPRLKLKLSPNYDIKVYRAIEKNENSKPLDSDYKLLDVNIDKNGIFIDSNNPSSPKSYIWSNFINSKDFNNVKSPQECIQKCKIQDTCKYVSFRNEDNKPVCSIFDTKEKLCAIPVDFDVVSYSKDGGYVNSNKDVCKSCKITNKYKGVCPKNKDGDILQNIGDDYIQCINGRTKNTECCLNDDSQEYKKCISSNHPDCSKLEGAEFPLNDFAYSCNKSGTDYTDKIYTVESELEKICNDKKWGDKCSYSGKDLKFSGTCFDDRCLPDKVCMAVDKNSDKTVFAESRDGYCI